MATVANQIQKVYIGLLGRAADAEGLAYWVNEIESGVLTLEQLRANIVNEQPEYAAGLGQMTRAQVVNQLYLNLFNRPAESEGLDYWVNGGGAHINVDQLVLALIDGAQANDTLALDNRASVADYYTQAAGANYSESAARAAIADVDGGSSLAAARANVDTLLDGPSGQSFMLTANADTGSSFVGSLGDDVFNAPITTINFANGNTLNTGDVLNGNGGNNTLEAALINDGFFQSGLGAVRPTTENIQNVIINAIETTIGEGEFGGNTVTLNAANMYGVENIWSKDSNANLVIQDITTLTSANGTKRNTEELTFRMDHTSNANTGTSNQSDLTVYFDENYLLSGEDAEGRAFYYLLDQDADLAGDPLLANINVDGLRFSIDGGDEIILASPDAIAANTHVEFVAALQTELNDLIAAGVVPAGTTVELDPSNTRTTFLDDGSVSSQVPAIIVTTGDGSPVEPIGFSTVAEEPGEFNLWTRFSAEFDVEEQPITTNLELHKAGRGDEGGDVHIGGKAGGSIAVVNVAVLGDEAKPSNIGQLSTGLNQGGLQTVNIATHDDYVDGDTFASLTIRDDFGNSPERVDANAFLGDLTLGSATQRFSDIETFTATGGGDVTYWAEVGGSASGVGAGFGLDSLENLDYSATTGAGADTINVDVNGGAQMVINAGAGDDTVIADIVGDTDSTSTRSSINVTAMSGDNTVTLSSGEDGNGVTGTGYDAGVNEAFVTTGDGVDIVTGGGTHLTASTGAGNDVIYAENTGAKTVAGIDAGVLTSTLANETVNTNIVPSVSLLNGRQVQITVAMPGLAGELTAHAAAAFTDGFELLADIQAAEGSLTTELDVYRAVRDAINDHPVVGSLAQASIDSNGNLTVNYLVDGVSVSPTDAIINLEVLGNWSDLNASQQNSIVADLQAEYSDSGIVAADAQTAYDNQGGVSQAINVTTDGSNSVTDGSNVVNAGTGQDVIVLSSAEATQSGNRFDTVEFDTGSFGENTIVHFQDGADGDVLDFTAWLDNVDSASGSSTSQVRVDTTLATATTFVENSVVVTDFSTLDGATSATLDFANMSDAQVLAALNANATFANSGANANLVGNVQKSIMFVENNDGTGNAGEYKVYQVTSEIAAGDSNFTGAELVGTVDFGDTQTFNVDNFA